jgi:hypothetical protein
MANSRGSKGKGLDRVKAASEPAETDSGSAQLSAALDLLREILKNGTNHNRRYCLYCKASMRVPIELHKEECVWRWASQLVNERKA